MARNSDAGRGGGRGYSARSGVQHGRGRAGRNFALTPVIRMAIGSVIDGFRALPTWAQRDAATMMMSLNPGAFQVPGLTGQGNPQPGVINSPNDAQQQSTKGSKAVGKTTTPGTDSGGQPAKKPTTRRLRGYDRQEICDLEFAKRLKNHPSDYSESQKKSDESLLSAATQVVSRGESVGATASVIAKEIASAKMSTESYRRLWPSKKTRKEFAIKHSPSPDLLPRIMTVDDEYVVYTNHKPKTALSISDGSAMDEGDDDGVIVSLLRVGFHSPNLEEHPISKEVVQSFIKGEWGNYKSLGQKIHLLGGFIAIYWIKGFSLDEGLSWADLDEQSVALVTLPCKSPKKKKRKKERTSGS